jgi:hypothetical protein
MARQALFFLAYPADRKSYMGNLPVLSKDNTTKTLRVQADFISDWQLSVIQK